MTKDKYYVEFFNSMCVPFSIEVEAESYKEAVEKAKKLKRRNPFRVWKNSVQTKQFADAESILLEMDANNTDRIIINEGMGIKTAYTRKQILESINSSNSIEKFDADEALSGKLD